MVRRKKQENNSLQYISDLFFTLALISGFWCFTGFSRGYLSCLLLFSFSFVSDQLYYHLHPEREKRSKNKKEPSLFMKWFLGFVRLIQMFTMFKVTFAGLTSIISLLVIFSLAKLTRDNPQTYLLYLSSGAIIVRQLLLIRLGNVLEADD